jgi:hypothetical protein
VRFQPPRNGVVINLNYMARRKPALAAAVVVSLAGLILFGLLARRTDKGVLIDRAFPKLSRLDAIGGYNWVSTNDIIYFARGESGLEARRVDLRTGQHVLYPHVSRELSRCHASEPFFLAWSISPDRQWLYLAADSRNGEAEFVASLDGETVLARPPSSLNAQRIWLPDSLGWVEMQCRRGIVVLKVKMLDPTRAGSTGVLSARSETLLGFALDGSLLVLGEPAETNKATVLPIISLDANILRTNTATALVQLPEGRECAYVAMSPHGARLAWLLTAYKRVPAVTCRRVFPFLSLSVTKAQISELWLSDVRGANMRRLGILPPDVAASSMRWSPDGNWIAYLVSGYLHALPLEGGIQKSEP